MADESSARESIKTRAFRWMMNCWPCFRGTGGRVTFVSADYRRVRVKLPLSFRTFNYVGTIYGGSMYGAVDPVYMLMLIKNLGPSYLVWDKAAHVRFVKPGRSTLYAEFHIGDDEFAAIVDLLQKQTKVDRHYTIELRDKSGQVHAVIDKVISIRKKSDSRN